MQRLLKFEIDNEEPIYFGSSPYFFDTIEGLSNSENELATYTTILTDGVKFNNSLLTERNIVINGRIRGNNREEALKHRRRLIKLCNSKRGLGKLTLIYPNGEEFFIEALANGGVNITEQNTSSMPSNVFEYQLTFTCPDPYWRQEAVFTTHFSQVIPSFEFALDIDAYDNDDMKFGEVYHSHNTILDNKGDAPSGFTCIAKGKITDYFILHNLDSGEFIKFERDFSNIESIEIYSHQGNKKVFFNYKNGKRENALKYLDLESRFFYLRAGENKLQFETNSRDVDLQVEISHHNLYVGL